MNNIIYALILTCEMNLDEKADFIRLIRIIGEIIDEVERHEQILLNSIPAYSKKSRTIKGGKKKIKDILLQMGIKITGGGCIPLVARNI